MQEGHTTKEEGGTIILYAQDILRVGTKYPLPFPEMCIGFA